MVTQIPKPQTVESTALPIGEERVILHNVSWETFERLVAETGDDRKAKFYYSSREVS